MFLYGQKLLPTIVGLNNSELFIFYFMKDDDKAIARLEIRLTSNEKALIKKYAKKDGLSVSDYIKRTALKQVVFSNRLEYTSDLRTLNFEIHKIGNNINQLAKHVNRADKLKTIDAGAINAFQILMEQYLDMTDEVRDVLNKMFMKMARLK